MARNGSQCSFLFEWAGFKVYFLFLFLHLFRMYFFLRIPAHHNSVENNSDLVHRVTGSSTFILPKFFFCYAWHISTVCFIGFPWSLIGTFIRWMLEWKVRLNSLTCERKVEWMFCFPECWPNFENKIKGKSISAIVSKDSRHLIQKLLYLHACD